MTHVCQRRHTCNNRCNMDQYKHHDIILQVNDERLLEDEIDSIRVNTFAQGITCHDIIKEIRGDVMFLAATLSPTDLCYCNGPCTREPRLEPSEA